MNFFNKRILKNEETINLENEKKINSVERFLFFVLYCLLGWKVFLVIIIEEVSLLHLNYEFF